MVSLGSTNVSVGSCHGALPGEEAADDYVSGACDMGKPWSVSMEHSFRVEIKTLFSRPHVILRVLRLRVALAPLAEST
jgi:hypothetical protein